MSNQSTFVSAFQEFLALRQAEKEPGNDAQSSSRASSDCTIPETPTEPSKYL